MARHIGESVIELVGRYELIKIGYEGEVNVTPWPILSKTRKRSTPSPE
jgi:hypothetical protein